MRFERKNDHYLDTKTGLQWSLDNIGPMTCVEATQQFLSDNEWRLPALKELLTLVDYKINVPATELPDMELAYYWSSTAHAYYPGYAWSVHFGHGCSSWDYPYNSYYVRAVRRKRIRLKSSLLSAARKMVRRLLIQKQKQNQKQKGASHERYN